MPRLIVLIFIACVLGLGLGMTFWMMMGVFETQSAPTTVKQASSDDALNPDPVIKISSKPIPAATTDQAAGANQFKQTQPSTMSGQSAHKQAKPIANVETEAKTGLTHNNSAQANKPSQTDAPETTLNDDTEDSFTAVSNMPIAVNQKLQVAKKPAQGANKRSLSSPYPMTMHGWIIRPYRSGCVATLTAKKQDRSHAIDPFNPLKLGMYVYYDPQHADNIDRPDWFGFVAPGRGEMSAKLLTSQGELIRGITGSTGLSWTKLVRFSQPEMEFRLTQCDLEGECTTHLNLLDLSPIQAVAETTSKCADRNI